MSQAFETIAAYRFGLGFAPGQADVKSVQALIEQTRSADPMATALPGVPLDARLDMLDRFLRANRARKRNTEDVTARKTYRRINQERRKLLMEDIRRLFARAIFSPSSLHERLAFFWADHFTVSPKTRIGRMTFGDYLDSAIRPHIGAGFGDMLVAAVTHPNMLLFLDQRSSVGPNSPLGKRKRLGLNENLAREILELHTLGADGAYGQRDVRQLAELLTGLTADKTGAGFAAKRAEPGAETVLGRSYGGSGPADPADFTAFLHDVARHPDTARHISRKLAVHFVDDEPDPDLVASMTSAFLDTGGDLPSVYAAMLDHRAAWGALGGKAKQPLDYMISGLRALGVSRAEIAEIPVRQANRSLAAPLAAMGQPLLRAPGPNGWPEEAEAWITPQGLAARLQWSLLTARRYGDGLDPRDFVDVALRDLAGDTLRRAVAGAEDRIEGLTLVLASPEFNRR